MIDFSKLDATYLTVDEKMDIIIQVLSCWENGADAEMISEDSGFNVEEVKSLIILCIRKGKPVGITEDGLFILKDGVLK